MQLKLRAPVSFFCFLFLFLVFSSFVTFLHILADPMFIRSTSHSGACCELGTTQCVVGLRHGVFDLKWRKIHVFPCDSNHDGFYRCHLKFSSALRTSFCKPCHPTTALTKRRPLDLDHGVVAPAHSFTDKPRGICAVMDTIA